MGLAVAERGGQGCWKNSDVQRVSGTKQGGEGGCHFGKVDENAAED